MDEKNEKLTSCIRCGDNYKCPVCHSEHLVKNGKTKSGKQRYSCKKCNKRFITNYAYNACKPNTNQQIILFTKEGLGIRSTARVLKISVIKLSRYQNLLKVNAALHIKNNGYICNLNQ